jgi:hypothetical protein
MNVRDRSPIWIGLADLLLCILSVTIVAAHPKSEHEGGVKEKAEYLASIEWDVNTDADVDIHMMPPSKKPVFYASRDVGCATVDRDNRGFLDSVITLADGSQTKVGSNKETIAVRCKEFGHYDLGANLYAYRIDKASQIASNSLGLKIHCEIVALNPTVKVLFSKDIVLDSVRQTVNFASFDMDRDGAITFTDPPIEPITASYQRRSGQT